MKLSGKSRLRKDAAVHADAKRPIESWIRVVESTAWRSITEVKESYRSADYVKGRTVFNIKGGRYRLIVVIDYLLQEVVYEAFLTHAEYDRYKFYS